MKTLPPEQTPHLSRRIALLVALALVAGVLVSGFDGASRSQVAFAQTSTEEPTVTPTVDPNPPQPPPEPPPEQPPPPWPPLPAGSGDGRRVVYSNAQQRVWLVEGNGEVVNSWLVSGRAGMPSMGVYRVFSKSRHSSAHGGRLGMEFMVRFARGRSLAIGFHSIPVRRRGGQPIQTLSELGHFRSAGCVRQRYEDAATLWEFAPLGTTVVVVESSKAKTSVKKCRRNCRGARRR